MAVNVLQIVPRLPPSVCGVGDQALALARALKHDHEIHSSFLVCDPAWSAEGAVAGFPVHSLGERQSGALRRFLDDRSGYIDGIIVQYSGYGFAPRGAPLWLANGLSGWRRNNHGRPLVTMYHELFSSGAITTSSFWFQPFQKWAIRSLARISSSVRTNRTAYQNWLARSLHVQTEKVIAMPVFSNFGETLDLASLGPKKNQMVVQGLGRTGDVAQSLACLERLVAQTGTELTKVIGPPPRIPISSSLRLEYTGHLPNEGVAQLLRESRRGYVDYYPRYFGKSSIHAAYCAHGLAAYTFGQPDDSQDGIRHGQQFFDMAREEKLPDAMEEIRLGEEAHSWYQGHNIRATAHSYADQLLAPC